MAKLIPNFCESKSPGERILFEIFSKTDFMQESTILHSLNIAKHLRNAEGEADFVFIIPKKGIFILEVKHHSRIKFDNGIWTLGQEKPTVRGPLQQARDAFYSIRKFLTNEIPELKRTPMHYFTWFTNTEFEPPKSIEWESWQFLSVSHLRNPEKWIESVIEKSISHLKNSKTTSNVEEATLTEDLAVKVTNLLRPNYETFLTEKQNRSRRILELNRFIDEQYTCLDIIEENERTLIDGPAGTGKTLLAIEKLKRINKNDSKNILICFNRNLAHNLAYRNPNLNIFTISSLILNIAKKQNINLKENNLSSFELAGPEKLNIEEKFETIIIDEAQDIFTKRFLPWIDKLLIGGLKNGKWHAFGDFKSQKLYQLYDENNLINNYTNNFVKANLSVNCRNLEVIGKLTNTLVPKSAKWKYFKRTENQVDPYIDFLSKDANFIEIIDRAIEYFRNQKFSFDDIIFLTPSAIENPSEVFQESKFASKFTKFDTNSVGKIGFSTIHAIKGLESPCVALIELYELKNMPEKSTLFYVALTRATDRLYIAADPESKKVIEEISNEK